MTQEVLQIDREAAAKIVADNIDVWGWGPLSQIEGLAEHTLAVAAAAAGHCLGRIAATQSATQEIERLRAALKAILKVESYSLHVGYDDERGGEYVYADVIRLDDDAFVLARAALQEPKP